MNEQDSRDRVLGGVSRETAEALDRYVALLKEEGERQNLISRSTVEVIWSRHILDSAQLMTCVKQDGLWLDIGAGAGLPALVIATLSRRQVCLIEPRKLRCAFLEYAAGRMGIADRVKIFCSTAEKTKPFASSIISARAVAPLEKLFALGLPFANPDTAWVLPKGKRASAEVAAAKRLWQARIELVPSITDSEAAIVVATDVRPRK